MTSQPHLHTLNSSLPTQHEEAKLSLFSLLPKELHLRYGDTHCNVGASSTCALIIREAKQPPKQRKIPNLLEMASAITPLYMEATY